MLDAAIPASMPALAANSGWNGRPNLRLIWPLAAIALLGALLGLPDELATNARLALFAFGSAAILWATTKLEPGFVALGAMLFLVLTGGVEQNELFETLESKVIWLMIGAFVIGAAAEESGLANRMSQWAASRVKSVSGMMWMVGAILVPMSFLIPSTSGRAAVTLPMFHSFTRAAGNRAVNRALGLLIPTVILVSTIASITGAGSHLIAIDLLDEATGIRVGFLDWVIWGVPFAIAATVLAVATINRQFLTRELLSQPLHIDSENPGSWSRAEKSVAAIFALTIALWTTESLHGFQIATVSILSAFAVTLPGLGIISWKKGLKAVSWPLIIFVGAALVLGEALIETGAANWLVDQKLAMTGLADGGSTFWLIGALAIISLTAHFYMTSHAARTAALVPPLLYLAIELRLDPTAVMFLATVGINYCLTFPVSSKALLMFQYVDGPTWSPTDLLKLSSILLPLHLLLMILFYFGYWQHVGLAL